MKKIASLIIIALCLAVKMSASSAVLYSQSPVTEPLHEMRAVWLTTIGGIDWPHSYANTQRSAAVQRRELCDILDKLVAAGINTVLLQTRIRATTIFPSDMEPWDGCLSGVPARSPGYDALAFAIEECHKRGIALHSWIVAIPIGKWDGAGCRSLMKKSPKLVKRIGKEAYMNPEVPETAEYLARFCRDIARCYDVDGIHLDYIRYPEQWRAIANRDRARSNITRIVRKVYSAVKAEKPWVMLSCSPIGKYADTERQCSNGWNARDIVCQDASQWLEEGIMDALFPMMYFRGSNFYPFLIDWMERSSGRIVTPGLGIYFLDKHQKDWPLRDITQEMYVSRQYGMGICMFRSKFFTDDTKGLYEYTRGSFSRIPALQPVMTWYETEPPTSPSVLNVETRKDGTLLLSWPGDTTRNILYNVYGSDKAPVDTRQASNLLMASYRDSSIVVPQSPRIKYFAITAVDRYGNESLLSTQSFYGESTREAHAASLVLSEKLLSYDGKRVYLDGCDVTEGQLLEVRTVIGAAYTSRLVKVKDGHLYFDALGITSGHYIVYMINKKGYQHRLGVFSIEP